MRRQPTGTVRGFLSVSSAFRLKSDDLSPHGPALQLFALLGRQLGDVGLQHRRTAGVGAVLGRPCAPLADPASTPFSTVLAVWGGAPGHDVVKVAAL